MNKLKSRLRAGIVFAIGVPVCAMAQDKSPTPIPNIAGKVQTVNGLMDPSALGETLMHEHIFIDFKKPPPMTSSLTDIAVIKRIPTPVSKGPLSDFNESLDAITDFKNAGGGTIVDLTNFGLTRDPTALKVVSRASGLNVVMGAGWYIHPYHPTDMDQLTVQQLTDIIVHDITVGAQGTNIRAGIIGEVGVGDPDYRTKPTTLYPNVIKSIRASARAARITGAPMSIHNQEVPSDTMQTLDIVQSEGVDLHHVVMSHIGARRSAEILEAVFARGPYIEWDFLGQAPLPQANEKSMIDSLVAMIKAGYASQIMISHDICTQTQLKINGGGGYTYIDDVIIPGLKAQGVSDATIHQIMVENPARVLAFVAPQPVVPQL